jgi:hypothetical protein
MFSARSLAASAAILFAALTNLPAQSVTTTPVGAVTVNVAAGTGTAYATTALSFPLLDVPQASGQMVGQITGVTANTITNSNAGWQAGQLSTAAAPSLIQITSGQAQGRLLLISTSTANTATTVTLDAEEAAQVNLTSLGVVAGDRYRIVACDTLSTLFGTPTSSGIRGGTAANLADQVQILVGGTWRKYYFNTSSNAWVLVGPNAPSNNIPIRPDTAVIYSRLANTPLTFNLTGEVNSVRRQAAVRNNGVTYLSTGWPVDLTLGTSKFNEIPGWRTSTNPANADSVQVLVSGTWRRYYHNGTQWLLAGPNAPSNGVVLQSGSAVMINRVGSTGFSTLAQDLPYTL